jgi:hypothetical protein
MFYCKHPCHKYKNVKQKKQKTKNKKQLPKKNKFAVTHALANQPLLHEPTPKLAASGIIQGHVTGGSGAGSNESPANPISKSRFSALPSVTVQLAPSLTRLV